MLNQVILVGRLVRKCELKKKDDKQYTKIDLNIANNNDMTKQSYESEGIEVIAFGNIAENVCKYCDFNDVIGIKGRLHNFNGEMQIIAERVSFLQSTHTGE